MAGRRCLGPDPTTQGSLCPRSRDPLPRPAPPWLDHPRKLKWPMCAGDTGSAPPRRSPPRSAPHRTAPRGYGGVHLISPPPPLTRTPSGGSKGGSSPSRPPLRTVETGGAGRSGAGRRWVRRGVGVYTPPQGSRWGGKSASGTCGEAESEDPQAPRIVMGGGRLEGRL